MADDILIPFVTEPEDLADEGIEYLQSEISGFEPHDADPMTVLVRAFGREGALVADTAVDASIGIFRWFGTLAGLPPIDAVAATVTAQFTMVDTAGYTIDEGTVVEVDDGNGGRVGFATIEDATVLAGNTTTTVTCVALEEGDVGNGYTGSVDLVDLNDKIASVSFTTTSANGQDAEEDDAYLERLRQRLQLLSGAPILPRDVAILAQDDVGVYRALAIDGYNPVDESTDNERMVAVAMVDEDGAAVSSTVKDRVEASLQAQRETNFVFHVIDPTYTGVDVQVEAVAVEGYDTTDVQTRVVAALTEYLSPGGFALPKEGDPLDVGWRSVTSVRYLELAEIVNNVDGVDYITTLELRLADQDPEDSYASVDVALAGAAPLPTAGDVAATITAAGS